MTSSVTLATANNSSTTEPPDIEAGTLTIYQLYDIGDEINLNLAQTRLAAPTVHRHKPPHVWQSKSIQIAQPPVRIKLGAVEISLHQISLAGILRASIYDLGAIAIAIELSLPQPTSWKTTESLQSIAELTYSSPYKCEDSRLKQRLQALPVLHYLTRWLMPQPFEYFYWHFRPVHSHFGTTDNAILLQTNLGFLVYNHSLNKFLNLGTIDLQKLVASLFSVPPILEFA